MEDEKLTIDQLAEKIKSKYPAYNDMDNTILVEKIIAKYPVYKDQLIEGSLKKKKALRDPMLELVHWNHKILITLLKDL